MLGSINRLIISRYSEQVPILVTAVEREKLRVLVLANRQTRHFANFLTIDEEQAVARCVTYGFVQ
jgi:hypothetical protein